MKFLKRRKKAVYSSDDDIMADTIPDPQEISDAPMPRRPIWGIVSIVLFALSMLPFMGIISLAGIATGIISIVREKHVTGILGTVLSSISLTISPTMWALLGAAWLGVYCLFGDCTEPVKNTQIAEPVTAPKPIVEQPVLEPTPTNAPAPPPAQPVAQRKQIVSVQLDYPDVQSWSNYTVENEPSAKARSVFIDGNHFDKYKMMTGINAIFTHATVDKSEVTSAESFINDYIDKHIRPNHPNIVMTAMDDMPISNSMDPALNTAYLRSISGGNNSTHEVVAMVNGGGYILMLVMSGATYEEMIKLWPHYMDIVTNHVGFKVEDILSATGDATPPAAPVTAPIPQPAQNQ